MEGKGEESQIEKVTKLADRGKGWKRDDQIDVKRPKANKNLFSQCLSKKRKKSKILQK